MQLTTVFVVLEHVQDGVDALALLAYAVTATPRLLAAVVKTVVDVARLCETVVQETVKDRPAHLYKLSIVIGLAIL